MPNVILTSLDFKREFKALRKKQKSLMNDIEKLKENLKENPKLGISIGKNCYKIRLKISSKNSEKSSGTRFITLVEIIDEQVTLFSIYDKSDKENLTEKKLESYLDSSKNEE